RVGGDLPDIESMRDLFGRSVRVCPYCDGLEHRNAPVAAFGKGDKGVGRALLLRQWTDDLVLCSHGPVEIGADDLRHLRGTRYCRARSGDLLTARRGRLSEVRPVRGRHPPGAAGTLLQYGAASPLDPAGKT